MEIIREILEQQRRVDEQREALRILIHQWMAERRQEQEAA